MQLSCCGMLQKQVHDWLLDNLWVTYESRVGEFARCARLARCAR